MGKELALKVSTSKPYTWSKGVFRFNQKPKTLNSQGKYHIVAFDFGIKRNILKCLVENNFAITVVPGTSTFKQIMTYDPMEFFIQWPWRPFCYF